MDYIIIKLLLFIAKAVTFTGNRYDISRRIEYGDLQEEVRIEMKRLKK